MPTVDFSFLASFIRSDYLAFLFLLILIAFGVCCFVFAFTDFGDWITGKKVYYRGHLWDKDVYQVAIKEVRTSIYYRQPVDAESFEAAQKFKGSTGAFVPLDHH
jgi:hypothetical protein